MSRPSKAQAHHPAGSRVHGAGVLRPQHHDALHPDGKIRQGTHCPMCRAEVIDGRWQWPTREQAGESPKTAMRCPACTRMAQHDPVGEILLEGDFVAAHLGEIKTLIAQAGEREAAMHPMERVMAVEPTTDGRLRVTTTGVHVARRVGHALERVFKGQLKTDYLDEEMRVRMTWTRYLQADMP